MPTRPPVARIGDYELLRCSVSGEMSEIHEGRSTATGQRVAVKILSQECSADEEFVARFRKEGSLLQRLHHARIVKVFDCGILPSGSPYMVLEWIPENLQEVLDRAKAPLPLETALQIVHQLADALAELHAQHIIHRDLKPSNVLLNREGGSGWEIKLADLGLAKAVLPAEGAMHSAHVSTGGGTILGTWDYMAPEQWIHSKSVDAKADVYALGVLLFKLVTGRLPFEAEQQKDLMYFHLLEQPPLEPLKGVVAPIRELILRMLDKKPVPRPSMTEVLQCTTPVR